MNNTLRNPVEANPRTATLAPQALVGLLALATLLALLAAAFRLAPGDVVESRYATLQSAREDQLFARGWLPDILPPSTAGIRVSNNLDLGTSRGGFALRASEGPAFTARLSGGALPAPFERWAAEVQQNLAAGLSVWHYLESDAAWVFFCRPDLSRCDYTMWTPRKG